MKKKIDANKILEDILIEKRSEAVAKDYNEFVKWFLTVKSTDVMNENEMLITILTTILKDNSAPTKERVKIAFCLGYWASEKRRQSNKSEL